METRYFRGIKRRRRSGIAGLAILLFGVGLLAILYLLYAGAFNPFAAFQGKERDRYSDPNANPWEEGHLFIFEALDGYDMGGRQPPFPSQPRLTDLLRYRDVLYDSDNEYGQIEMMISDDGDARVLLNGEFQIEGKQYQAIAQPKAPGKSEKNRFHGNIAPLKIYEDENGKDKSKLYVITQGLFHLKGSSDESSLEGGAYVTCWIDKDYKAEGKLTIPFFKDERTVIFYWGPVGPIEE
jgi:hypothetical protein